MRKPELEAGKATGAAHQDGAIVVLQVAFVPGVATGGAKASAK